MKLLPKVIPLCLVLLWASCVVSSLQHVRVVDETPKTFSASGGVSAGDVFFNLSDSNWRLTNANNSINIPATVPGVTHTDLMAAGIIGNPYYRYNDVDYRWISLEDWKYSHSLPLPQSSFERAFLIFEGLDTVARIVVNGYTVAQTDNMFRRYIFDVTDAISTKGNNELEITFTSASTYANQKMSETPYPIPFSDTPWQHGEPNRNFIRKAQCHFSWDWGPCFLTAGVWRPAYLLYTSGGGFITQVAPSIVPLDRQSLKDWQVDVRIFFYVASASGVDGQFQISLAGEQKTIPVHFPDEGEHEVTAQLKVSNVDLWYPAGYGAQVLYPLSVSFLPSSNGGGQGSFSAFQSVTQKVGFRFMELVQEPIWGQEGLSFFIQVNHLPIFAKGANWIPADSFESRVTPSVLKGLLESARDANMNIVRNWGGGIYQHDAFYDLCDEMGLMVWEEFMFACAMYPRDSAFLSSVRDEVEYQVRRLMFHPSIVIWSANNENEAALGGWYPETQNNPFLYVVDYEVLYSDTVRSALLQNDLTRPWLPSSPSNGIIEDDPYVQRWGNPYDNNYGDTHYYNYDAPCTNVTFFPTPRFASEFGFQALPSLFTWQGVSEESDWRWDSRLMEHRQHHKGGNLQLRKQMAMHFRLPSLANSTQEFGSWVYLTQCVQALCIKAESEHYRRLKSQQPQTMGAIYWQLNSIWPAPTWSSLEYGGRWKMLHYFAREFFAPSLISAYENPEDELNVHVTSDLPAGQSGQWTIRALRWADGAQVGVWNGSAALAPFGSEEVYKGSISQMLLPSHSSRSSVVFLVEWDGQVQGQPKGQTVQARNEFYPSSFANVTLPVPSFQLKVVGPGQGENSAVVEVTSSAMAPFVFLQTSLSGRFSENGMLLRPNLSRNVTFVGWEEFSLSALQSSLSAISVRDTYN